MEIEGRYFEEGTRGAGEGTGSTGQECTLIFID